jgi:hypothetical protein
MLGPSYFTVIVRQRGAARTGGPADAGPLFFSHARAREQKRRNSPNASLPKRSHRGDPPARHQGSCAPSSELRGTKVARPSKRALRRNHGGIYRRRMRRRRSSCGGPIAMSRHRALDCPDMSDLTRPPQPEESPGFLRILSLRGSWIVDCDTPTPPPPPPDPPAFRNLWHSFSYVPLT